MYPGHHAKTCPDKAAAIHARTGEVLSYAELDARSNRLAQLLWAEGLRRGDHVAVFLENHLRYFEVAWAAFRSGLYLTTVNRYLTAPEAGYIVDDCGAQVLVSSRAVHEVGGGDPRTGAGLPALPGGRRPARRRRGSLRELRGGPRRAPAGAPRGGAARRVHALQLGDHRAAQGDHAALAEPAGVARPGDERRAEEPLPRRRGLGLSLARADVPLGADRLLHVRSVARRHGGHDGSLRRARGACRPSRSTRSPTASGSPPCSRAC